MATNEGTGKTRIISQFAELSGFTPLTQAFSAGQMTASLVGQVKQWIGQQCNTRMTTQTEDMLLKLARRGNRITWAPVCFVIDEIDSLCPDRTGMLMMIVVPSADVSSLNAVGTNGASASKADSMGVLFSLLDGGVNDIPNMFVFGTTNIINAIDPAFLRRMTSKVFVGLPGMGIQKDDCYNDKASCRAT
jgi:hypothetical protein